MTSLPNGKARSGPRRAPILLDVDFVGLEQAAHGVFEVGLTQMKIPGFAFFGESGRGEIRGVWLIPDVSALAGEAFEKVEEDFVGLRFAG